MSPGGGFMGVSEKKLAKKVKMIDAAYNLFLEKGVNITAIDDVVKKAGVAKGTFYLYFKDKYDLLDQIVISKSEAIVKIAVNALRKKREEIKMTPADEINFFTDRIIDCMMENKELAALIHKNLSACFDVVLSDGGSAIREELKEVVGIMMTTGISERSALIHLYMFTGMIGSACFDAVVKNTPFSVDELRPEIHTMVNKLMEGES